MNRLAAAQGGRSWGSTLVVPAALVLCASASAQPSFSSGMTRPSPVRPLDWRWPEHLRRLKVQDTLVVRCVITETGKVQECDPIKNVPGFSGWAIDQLESAQFVPAMMDGKPARITYIFNFRIGNPTAVVPTEVASWQPTVDEETLSRCKAENAARCHEAALVLLGPKGGSASQDRAARILAAACAGGSPGACAFLARHFTGPKLLDALTPPRPGSGIRERAEFVCRISVTGRTRDCRSDNAPLLEAVQSSLGSVRFIPAKYEGVPFETEHVIRFSIEPR